MTPVEIAAIVFAITKEAISLGEHIYAAETEQAAELAARLQSALAVLVAARQQAHADADARLRAVEAAIAEAAAKGSQ